MSKLTLLVLTVVFTGSLACQEQYHNKTRSGGYTFRYDYNRGRYTSYETLINNCTIVCANIYSIGEIYYIYKDKTYEQFLEVTNSNITALEPNELSQFATITKLYLRDIHLKRILPGAFSGLSRLKELYLDRNELTEVSKGIYNSLQWLQVLDLSGNKIHQLENFALMGVSNLQRLHLQNNQLSNVGNDTFNKLNHLTYLDVSENPLNEIALGDLYNLDVLNLSTTNLTNFGDLSKTNWTIRFLNLSHSQISSVDFSLFPKTKVLDLSNNAIDSVVNCHQLQSMAVSLKNNKIKSIRDGFNGVSQIFLSHNQIEEISSDWFSNSTDLLLLDLSFNNISSLKIDTFEDLTSLNTLNLQNNHISELDPAIFRNLTRLTYLDISYNRIDSLQFGTFNNMKSLLVLDVSHNELKDLHPFEFHSLSQLQKLIFDHNQVSSFDITDLTVHLPSLYYVSLDGNPWRCKQLVGMSHALQNMSVRIAEGSSYDVENFKGIACRNDPEDPIPKGRLRDLERIVNETVRGSQIERYLNEGFMSSKFVEFFEKTYNESEFFKSQHAVMGARASPEVRSREGDARNDNSSLLILSVVLQIVMCSLLVFMSSLMFKFLKTVKHGSGSDRLSQVELC